MIKPIRIQRSRQSKQITPNGLDIKYVGRPTKFGNPFKLIGDTIYIDASYRRKVLDPWVYFCHGDLEKCVRLYECVVTGMMQEGEYGIELDYLHDLSYWVNHFKSIDLSELKGKNLSCWCSTYNTPCHADVLLKLSNNGK